MEGVVEGEMGSLLWILPAFGNNFSSARVQPMQVSSKDRILHYHPLEHLAYTALQMKRHE